MKKKFHNLKQKIIFSVDVRLNSIDCAVLRLCPLAASFYE